MSFLKRYYWVLLPFCVIFAPSCSDDEDKEYTVDSELNFYLQRFLNEASKRGKNFNVESDGLIMEFADLKSPVVGLCTYSDPIKVQIDRTYWEETARSDNRENLREDVVFHELAHGLLRRSHDNAILPNTEWKTIMCGGSEIDGRSWAINFNGARKQYYLDELFSMIAKTPDYAYRKTFDGKLGTVKFSRNYETEPDSEKEQEEFISQVKDGVRIISNVDEINILLPMIRNLSSADFHFDVVMKTDNPSSYGICGLFVSSKSNDSNYFGLANNNRVTVWNTKCILPFAEVLVDDLYQNQEFTKFSLRKEGDELFFYINDELAYWNDYALDSYTTIGVILPNKGSLKLRSYVYYDNSELKSATIESELKAVPLIQKRSDFYDKKR